jgi:hypothetical protein
LDHGDPALKLHTVHFNPNLISLGEGLISPPPDFNCLQKTDRLSYLFALKAHIAD